MRITEIYQIIVFRSFNYKYFNARKYLVSSFKNLILKTNSLAKKTTEISFRYFPNINQKFVLQPQYFERSAWLANVLEDKQSV